MTICQQLAGYSLGAADQVRRYMSKKKHDKLAHEREAFIFGDAKRNISGCVSKGISEEAATKLFDQMMDFASYAFNKSHAAAYAYNCYLTAWLKCYYPVEFFASAMDWVENIDKLSALLYEASTFGVEVLPPDINKSKETFSVVDGKILFGLSSIARIKNNAAGLIEDRGNGEYESLKDFFYRAVVSRSVAENLIKSGAMDTFCDNRAAMLLVLPDLAESIKKLKAKEGALKAFQVVLENIDNIRTVEDLVNCQKNAGCKIEVDKMTTKARLEGRIANAQKAIGNLVESIDSIMIPVNLKEDVLDRMNNEKECLGMYVTDHPMNYYPAREDLGIPMSIAEFMDNNGKAKRVYGLVKEVEIKNRKKDGAPIAFFKLEDQSGTLNCAIFAKQFKQIGGLLKEGDVVILSGDAFVKESFNREGEQKVEILFSTDNLRKVEPRQSVFQIEVSSYAVFHIRKEREFITKYKSENFSGHPLRIFDRATGEILDMKYHVKDSVKKEYAVYETETA